MVVDRILYLELSLETMLQFFCKEFAKAGRKSSVTVFGEWVRVLK